MVEDILHNLLRRIINGVQNQLGNNIKLCRVSSVPERIYQRVQAERLQVDYQNADVSSIRDALK